eukprot:s3758_g13.t1
MSTWKRRNSGSSDKAPKALKVKEEEQISASLRDEFRNVVRQLGQLICLHGFTTNPQKPGVECLVVTRPREEIGMVSDLQCNVRDIFDDEGGVEDMLPPHGVVFCKGWTRSFVFITVMRLCYDHPAFLEARHMRTVFARQFLLTEIKAGCCCCLEFT